MTRYEDEERYRRARKGFGRSPVRGSSYDSGGYEREPMSGRDYSGRRGRRGHYYPPDPYDQTGFRPPASPETAPFGPYYEARPGESYVRRPGYGGPYREDPSWGYRSPADRIRDQVRERLERYGFMDAFDIRVSVEGDEVRLEGTVESRADKRLAEDVAEQVAGVRDVHNWLRLRREE